MVQGAWSVARALIVARNASLAPLELHMTANAVATRMRPRNMGEC
jgi:hypothetical protein